MDKSMLVYECSQYFKSSPGFARALKQIKEKYQSLGKIGGTIALKKLTTAEQDALSGFLKANYYQEQVRIRVEKFQQALDGSKFAGVDLVDILHAYFDEEIATQKDIKAAFEAQKARFWHEMGRDFAGTRAYEWYEHLFATRNHAYRLLNRRYHIDPHALARDLKWVLCALNDLPRYQKRGPERLAIFSSHLTQNPHAFDEQTEAGILLLHGISDLLGKHYPKNAEEKTEDYYAVGLIKDEISNYTVCSGLLACRRDGLDAGWQSFYEHAEPMHVSLWNLSQLERVVSPKSTVYVFENPSVFSEVLSRCAAIKPALLCTFGQVKLASLILLDMLVKEGVQICYSGDFDPEGLSIAGKLKARYGDSLTLWHYTPADYERALSGEKIEAYRLKQLDKLSDEQLITTGVVIKNKGYAGYQELIIEDLLKDIS